MCRITDGRIGAELVDRVSLISPPVWIFRRLFGGHHCRKHSVVVDVIPIVTRPVSDNKLFEPLNTPAADLARYHGPQRLTMVRSQHLSVHLMGQHEPSIWIHNPTELDRSAIITIRKLVSPFHADILGLSGRACSPYHIRHNNPR